MKKITQLFMLLFQFLVISATAQSLVSISPNTSPVGQSVAVTIIGSGTSFGPATQIALNLGTDFIIASNIHIVSATELTADLTIPTSAASGQYMLIANSGLNILQMPDAFTVTGGTPAASIVSVSPNSGAKGETLLITITGEHTSFTQSSNTTVSLFAAGTPILATGVFPISNTRLSCLVNIPSGAATGAHSLVVTTSNDGILIKPNAFTVTGTGSGSPRITAISPPTGARGQTLNVTITGANTEFLQSSDVTVALFDGASPITSNFAFATTNTSVSANFTIPANATIGAMDVEVLTSNQGLLSLPEGFTITAGSGPQLVSVSPAFAGRGQTLDVTITGANTSFQQASNSLMVFLYNQASGISPNFVNAISNTEVTANFTIPSDFPEGVYTVATYNDLDGELELPDIFTIVTTGIGEQDQQDHALKAYPNPVHETLIFESRADVKEVILMDIAGKQTVVPLSDVNVPDEHTYSFNINKLGLTPGIYFLRVDTDEGSVYQKIMVN